MQKEAKKSIDSEQIQKRAPIVFHLEADRILSGLSVSVSSVISVIDFNTESALLKLRRGKLKISGAALSIAVYENRIVEISGKVGAIEFL